MSYKNRLIEEINGILNRLAKDEKMWKAQWIAHEICKNHEGELLYNADFSRYNNYANVRREVTSVINKRAGDKPEKSDNQLILDGFEFVQSHYVVNRGGEDIGVPIYQMTPKEIDQKISIHEKMAKANQAHADELRQFKSDQFPKTEAI